MFAKELKTVREQSGELNQIVLIISESDSEFIAATLTTR